MSKQKFVNLGKLPYWYDIKIEYCVICGAETVWKHRKYTPRPKERKDRVKFTETACSNHFI